MKRLSLSVNGKAVDKAVNTVYHPSNGDAIETTHRAFLLRLTILDFTRRLIRESQR